MKRVRTENYDQPSPQVIKVNAGGMLFITFLDTLTKSFPNSLIAKQFNDLDNMSRDEEGHYFVDMSPNYFAVLLDILRNPQLLFAPPKEMSEAAFNALVDFQELKCEKRDIWSEKRLEIQNAWRDQHKVSDDLDEQVFKLILGWIDLPALILGPETTSTFYIPYGVYKLRDDADLCLYIQDSLPQLQALLDKVSNRTASIGIVKGSLFSKEVPDYFVFEGVSYISAKTSFYKLTINI